MSNVESILIVDDDTSFTELLKAMLEKAGFSTITASSGNQAFALMKQRQAEAGDAQIKAIVSDWMMQDGDGVALLAQVRGSEFHSTPFLLVSGAVSREQLTLAGKNGADGVLLKPFQTEALLRKVEDAINHRMQIELARLSR